MKTHAFLFFCLITTIGLQAQSVSTTTISGSLRIMDSLQVSRNINTTSNITSSGEVVAMDTIRAQKDVLVDGNANIGNNLNVSGFANLHALRVGGPISFQPAAPHPFTDPCISLLVAVPDSNGGQQLTALSPAETMAIEDLAEADPCPQPPAIPFTWQTYGNHVSSGNRWIGTIENHDFNIKTNNTFLVVCKANGDIGLGAFGGNNINSNGKKYRFFIANSGELSAGLQDAAGKYPFVVKPNGALSIGTSTSTTASPYMLDVNGTVNIGTAFPTSSPYMLTVNGRIGAREIKVSIQNPWPDYVFHKGYRLKPLEEVQEYIRTHKHLPGVPDAESLSQELCGLDLAQMQGIQMEKIEEIYLHLIELNKEVQKLKQENELLKHKN